MADLGNNKEAVTLRVNGEERRVRGGGESLLAVLRDQLSLTGAKPGCLEGACGACTVLVDGQAVLSCQTTPEEVAGRSVTTVEGADGPVPSALKEALAAVGAAQCGYCSPAMVLRASVLLEQGPQPSRDEVRQAMAPNLCRCGCYKRIAEAIEGALEGPPGRESAGSAKPPPNWRPDRPFDLTPPAERQWFELLGDGFVATSSPELEGSSPGRSGAWIHLSPSGEITAFVGKVDVGQDNTTAFRLLVAEELSVDPARVQVVLGDTDLCPYDMGTFASRSMPDAGRALRYVAAGLRRRLVAEAAGRLGLPARALKASDGAVRSDNAAIEYTSLVGQRREVEVVGADEELLGDSPRRQLTSRLRPRQEDAFSGSRLFVSDMRQDEMLYGAVIHPPMAGDNLRGIDRQAIADLEDVTLVEQDGLCAVLAPRWATARRAAKALAPAFEEAETSFGDLAGYLRSHRREVSGFEAGLDEEKGEPEAGLRRASSRLEETYSAAYIAHVPLETRAALARFDGERLTVFVGTQTPFRIRSQLAEALGLPEEDVRVVARATGGAFGGKHGADVALEAARLAQIARRPVLVHWSREDEFGSGYLRPAAVIDIRAGVDESGAITAFELVDTNAGGAGMAFPYRTENSRFTYVPSDPPLRQGSYRALAATANNFARESAIDELAAAAGTDPAAFRLAHLEDDRLREVLERALDSFGWSGDSSGEHGFGVAVGLEKDGRVATCAEVAPDREGFRVLRLVTAYDCGRVVNRDTVVNQIEGASVMALGGALFEEIELRKGRQVTRSLSDYRVPRFTDMPEIDVELVERPEEPPAGAGETPLIAVAPAIANAVFQGTGVRLRNLPLLPAFRRAVG